MVNEEVLILKAYVEVSSYRLRTLQAIGEDVKMPKTIANDSGILPNHISKVLRELKEHDIAVCINPEMRKGKLYKLTDMGLQVLEIFKNEEL